MAGERRWERRRGWIEKENKWDRSGEEVGMKLGEGRRGEEEKGEEEG